MKECGTYTNLLLYDSYRALSPTLLTGLNHFPTLSDDSSSRGLNRAFTKGRQERLGVMSMKWHETSTVPCALSVRIERCKNEEKRTESEGDIAFARPSRLDGGGGEKIRFGRLRQAECEQQ